MAELKPEIDEKAYRSGIPLKDAPFKFVPPELVKAYKESLKISERGIYTPEKDGAGILGVLTVASREFEKLRQSQEIQEKALKALYRKIFELVEKGDLIPYSYQTPRKLSDSPIRIPIDIFLDGEIDWDNSELAYKNFEFTGIRLLRVGNLELKNISPEPKNNPEIKPDKKEIFEKIPDKKSKKEKQEIPFSELDPERLVDEKIAAEFLGISPRTLQGYRTRGGGPEFHKISHKVVRYKVADLIAWVENRKKRNTSIM